MLMDAGPDPLLALFFRRLLPIGLANTVVFYLAFGWEGIAQPGIPIYFGFSFFGAIIGSLLRRTGKFREEHLIYHFYPSFLFLNVWFSAACTGGLRSPFLPLLQTAVIPAAATSSPTLRISLLPMGALFLVGYCVLMAFSALGNPFPQYIFPQDLRYDVLSFFLSLTTLASSIGRFQNYRNLAVAAIEKETRANEAKSQFVAMISHEMRTPLTSILGWADILERSSSLAAGDREVLETIQVSGRNLLSLINDILDYSKIQQGMMAFERIPFRIESTVRDIFESSRVLVKPAVHFSFTCNASNDLHVMGDPHRLSQALSNLLSNAAKFTDQGEINLSVHCVEVEPGKRVATKITVRDTGIGMSEETLGRLFRPFTQAERSTSRRFGGTGLGLSITKQIVESMGGKLSVTSNLGQGSSFSWTIEMDVAAAPAKDASPVEVGPSPLTERLKVLLVEDNILNQKLLLKVLSLNNCEPRVASNGREALYEVENNPFDLILMDVEMPVMDGFTATRALRELSCKIPIVGLTANSDAKTRAEAEAVGMDDLLTKPVALKVLARTLDSYRPRSSIGPEE